MSREALAVPHFPPNRWRDRLIELGIDPPPPGVPDSISREDALNFIRARENELACIYSVTQLMDREQYDVASFMARVVDVLPAWWQYPEVACARIRMGRRVFKSLHYRLGPAEQVAAIEFPDGVKGELAIIYTEERPAADEGPFLGRERKLIDAVAGRLVQIVARNRNNARLAESLRQLEVERASLREANAALRLVLERIEEEKRETQREILDNLDKILMPIIRELEASAAPGQLKHVAMLTEHLKHITSPFVRSLARASQSLTPTEIQVCRLIRDGMGSKEIAELRNVSVATIHRHREHIRRKLGLANRKVNLSNYLQRNL